MIQGPTDEAVPKWLGVAHCLLENVCKNVLYTNYSFTVINKLFQDYTTVSSTAVQLYIIINYVLLVLRILQDTAVYTYLSDRVAKGIDGGNCCSACGRGYRCSVGN